MKKLFLLTATLCFLLFTGCSLEEEPQSILTPGGGFYSTKKGMETLVYSCYSKLRFMGGGTNLFKLNLNGTDIVQAGTSNHPSFYDNYTIPLTEGAISGLWSDAYTIINACNYVTKYISTVTDMTDKERQTREAEARFIRALMYYHLSMQFGDVHFTLEATENVETTANRTAFNTIWDEGIYPDLRYALTNLPVNQPDYGRIDVWGAKFFMSYALLSDPRSGNAQFNEAAALAASVINESKYSLQPNRYLVFDEDNEGNSEIIWSIQFPKEELYLQGGNYSHLIYVTSYQDCPGMERVVQYGRSYIQYKPTQFYFDLYDETIDSRYEAYWLNTWLAVKSASVKVKINDVEVTRTLAVGDTAIYMPKKPWSKDRIDSKTYRVFNPESSTPVTGGGGTYYKQDLRYYPTLKKFIDSKRPTPNEARGTRNWVVFRLAEAYLLAGEAYFRGGDKANAVKYINVLRRNAALPGKESAMEIKESDLSVDFILDERARELFGEDNRWCDLKRLGKLQERAMMNPYHPAEWKDHFKLRPIPQSHIDRCSNKYDNNPGW